MNFSCAVCGEDSGTSLVCPTCIPTLSDYKKDQILRVWHRMIVERDQGICAYCEVPGTWESGERAGNHNPTQAAAPLLVFDVTLHECTCKGCNGRYSYSSSIADKKSAEKNRPKKAPVCPKCRLRLAIPSAGGRCVQCSS